jgi:RNA polymerase sigma factor (TIGR02999 family)
MEDDSQLPGEVTSLLRRWSAGDATALGALVEVAYPELRAVAVGYLRRQRSGDTLQATGLVNELYLRLARQRSVEFGDRRHFYRFAAMLMRRILSDYSRQGRAQRRTGIRIPLHPDLAWVDAAGEDMLALDNALAELEALDERKTRTVELRYFLGCTNEETAELMGVARATVDRDLLFAKSWLHRRLFPQAPAASSGSTDAAAKQDKD